MHKKGITLQLLWEEYVEAHSGVATYRYTRFCRLYHDYAATLKRSMRQIHRAGEKLFIDYAGPTVPIIDQVSGEISRAHIFVAVLGASNYTYACATARETQADTHGLGLGLAVADRGGSGAAGEVKKSAAYHPARPSYLLRACEKIKKHASHVIVMPTASVL
jgi:hypothetical protein